MRIVLAGFNLDNNIVKKLKEKAEWTEDNLTPETISAAYARISRNPADIPELRKKSLEEVDKARTSNNQIIFGLGHASVAEHAVFNLDIMDLSRLAVEYLQKHRLASFTEKSQRYIKIKNGYHIPETLSEHLKKKYINAHQHLFLIYEKLYSSLKEHIIKQYGDKWPLLTNKRDILNKAKEDARYILPLSTYSQLGMTVNSRSLEHIIKSLKSEQIHELTYLGDHIFKTVHNHSPSIIKYTEPEEYDTKRKKDLKNWVKKNIPFQSPNDDLWCESLISDFEDRVLAAFIYQETANPFTQCLNHVQQMNSENKKELFKMLLAYKKDYHTPDRFFEIPEFLFDVTISSSCYAQLKRHRVSTQICSPYDTKFGAPPPPQIIDANLIGIFQEGIQISENLMEKIKQEQPDSAPYALTNAHRKKVLVKMNAREIYHFISLRADIHSQWEIRELAIRLKSFLKQASPNLFSLLKGKQEG